MNLIVWAIAALAAGLLAVVIAARPALEPRAPLALPPGERLPSTPLQRLARWSIAGGLLFAAAAAALVVGAGVARFDDDGHVRLTVTALLLCSIAVLGFFGIRTRSWVARGDDALDERDQAILGRAPAAQAVAMLVTLAVWIVGLQQTFPATRLVPVIYLYLVFWSCVVVDLVALPVGVLLGYRRS
jgi:hypothetical protein